LEVVRSQILSFFSSWGGAHKHYGIFYHKPTLNNPSVMSLQMYYCASSVSLDTRVLAGLGEFPVKSNEMVMKRTGN